MFSGMIRQARLRLQAQTGLGTGVVAWSLVAAISAATAFLFLCVAAFVWIADRYDAFTAGLSLGIVFLLVTFVATSICIHMSKRTAEMARVAAAASPPSALPLDPRLVAVGLEIGRAIGLRRLIPVAAVGLLAALGGREWFAQANRKSRQQNS
jgi:hypothetical protein